MGERMEDFLTSERFEQMAREYNAKYRQANVLEKTFDKNVQENAEIGDNAVEERQKANFESIKNTNTGENAGNELTDEQKTEIADILMQMTSLVKICEARMSRNLIFFGKNDTGEKLLEKIHKTALKNNILFENGKKKQFFLGNDRNFVLKLIKVEKFFAKNEKIAKVQCLCDIHEEFLDYVSSFCERF